MRRKSTLLTCQRNNATVDEFSSVHATSSGATSKCTKQYSPCFRSDPGYRVFFPSNLGSSIVSLLNAWMCRMLRRSCNNRLAWWWDGMNASLELGVSQQVVATIIEGTLESRTSLSSSSSSETMLLVLSQLSMLLDRSKRFDRVCRAASCRILVGRQERHN